ncbi:MAG TPA: hypothetical protein PLE45_05780 [Spirochaetota bacterium]|nr:hypothetical protein [Spirochaetota bacterium]HOL56791.1 hypothetical protein [Spirochaetota bacterium]HPP04258.1 hypothetical protein [Spirochaetota bacterium]
MEDRSVIQPILEALEYFNKSKEELDFFYNIIDKFCVSWFGKPVMTTNFTSSDLFLIHDLLGEYLRFEGNSKKIALWLLAINRVCYNYTQDLSKVKKEVEELKKISKDELDTSLIDPILNTLRNLEELHLTSSINNKPQEDIINNFLQWVGIYTTFIYPSLENKMDFYDKNILRAMNFLLSEFLKQKTNDKRLAFLIIAIMEACKQYSLQNNNINPDLFTQNSEIVVPGKEEKLVEELLNKLKKETERQRKSHTILSKEILADQFVKDSFDKFIDDINNDPTEAVAIFNDYSFKLANNLIKFDTGKQFLFLQTLSRYRTNVKSVLKQETYNNLKKSVEMLSDRTKEWFKNELARLNERKDLYIEFVIQKMLNEKDQTKANTAKLFIMLYLIKKLELL